MISRSELVMVARSWRGTPYHHRGKIKGVGADCGTLIVAVFAEAGAIEDFDPGFYTRDWHLHRDEERYLSFVEERLSFIGEADTVGALTNLSPGQVLVWKVGRTYSHGAIMTSPTTFIHASHPANCVEEIAMVGCYLEGRKVRVYDFDGFAP